MALDSTKDLLFLALTVATVVLTFFLAWFLYYLVSIIRQGHAVMKEVADGMKKMHEILDSIKTTIHESSSHLSLVVSAVKQLASFYVQRRRKRDTDTADSPKRGKKE